MCWQFWEYIRNYLDDDGLTKSNEIAKQKTEYLSFSELTKELVGRSRAQ